jgi:serine protease AprX
MRARYLILAIALLCLLALPSAALAKDGGDNAKIDDSVTTVLDATGNDEAVPVIVYTDPGAGGVVDDVVPSGVETTDLADFDAVAAYLTEDEIDALAARDAVDLIVADNPVFGFDYASSLDITNLAIGLDKVKEPAAGGPAGAGVGVAIVDSGIATTSDLGSSRIIGWKDFVNKKKAPYDDAGHGTFVAGLIAGDGTASLPVDQGGVADVQFRGVAPQADIIAIKVLDDTGQGRASSVMAGIVWAMAHRNQYNIRVLNLSIGSNPVAPTDYDPIARAVELAWKHGITVVCAAGNEGEFGPGGILSPGDSPYVITVGASDTRQSAATSDDAVTYYSSVGPTLWDEYAKPDLVAPGNKLISLRVRGSYIDTDLAPTLVPVNPADTDPSYLMLSGTSTSAPVGAGVAALMIGQDPSLSPDDVKVRMMRTADPLPYATRFQQGAGLIDAAGALASHARSKGYALSEDVGDGTTILTKDDYAAWDQIVWTKYGWTKFRWTKFRWTGAEWTKFRWTKFRWTGAEWTKFRWTKFRWTNVAWTKFRWTKFRWTDYEWAKFRWTILIEGQ